MARVKTSIDGVVILWNLEDILMDLGILDFEEHTMWCEDDRDAKYVDKFKLRMEIEYGGC